MIFIDTGAFLARYLLRDQHHLPAVVIWEKLGSNFENCVTSNFVLDEINRVFSFDRHFELAGFHLIP